jgi:glucokinase
MLKDGQGGPFLRAFYDKGRLSPLLQRVPLCIITAGE